MKRRRGPGKALAVTGAELAERVRRRARELGLTFAEFAAPLSAQPSRWLSQLEGVTPKPRTVERMEALLAGKPVSPPLPSGNAAKRPRAAAMVGVVADPRTADNLPEPVSRDPCPKCGTRADIGCKHSRPAQ